MGPLSCRLLASDVQMIYSRAKDKSDTSCVAAVTLDYILRQTGSFLSLKATRHELRSLTTVYSQFVCAAFGLDKMNSMHIGRLARNFLGTVESARVHLGLKYAETGDTYEMDKAKNAPIKQVSFLKYYTDSLSRYLSQQFQWYINMFSQAHQLSSKQSMTFCFVTTFCGHTSQSWWLFRKSLTSKPLLVSLLLCAAGVCTIASTPRLFIAHIKPSRQSISAIALQTTNLFRST